VITDWIIGLASGFVGWVMGFLGTADPPAFVSTVATFIGTLLTSVAGLGAWVPWPLVLAVAGANLGLWVVFALVKGIRWVVGLIPTMGGG
jgi:hypothetical protein